MKETKSSKEIILNPLTAYFIKRAQEDLIIDEPHRN